MLLEALDGCFSSEVGFLCPTNVLRTVSSLKWLGFAWNPELKLSFPRNHLPAPTVNTFNPLFILVEDISFLLHLRQWSQTLVIWILHHLRLIISLANVTFTGMKTSLATCPCVSLPLFSSDSIVYVPWDPDSNDMSPLQLHHESLSIPPPVVINRSVINEFDEMFEYYNSQLSSAIEKADDMVNQVEVTSETRLTEYIAYAALGLSVLNFIFCCVPCQCLRKIVYHRLSKVPQTKVPVQTVLTTPLQTVPTSPPHKICKHCDKPVQQGHQSPKIRKV